VAETVFDMEGLGFAYGSRAVLSGLDLRILPGRFYGIVGRNGCGKTTLLDLMTGVRAPRAGTIRVMGRRLGDYRGRELARTVALVPQEFASNFPFTVWETMLMGRHPHLSRFASPSADDLASVEEAMAALDVEELADNPVTELSGGEKQRVALARALAQDTPVILLDEPTSNLDVNHSLAVLAVMEERVRLGCTVVAVLHDIGLAAAFCDHLVFLTDARVFVAGPTEDVLNAENLAAVFGVEARITWDEFAGCRTVVFRKEGYV
jgi:iron complex transport system ATP-binding protein